MGATMAYRKEPLLDFESQNGSTSVCDFGASRITGWRKSQEDRLCCLPEFVKGFSLFAVYDGHGGSEVAEYLYRHFPKHLESFLNAYEVELALQLSFLSFDNSIRSITEEEKSDLIGSDMDEDHDIPDKEEVLTALRSYSSNVAGSSREGTNNSVQDLKSRIASETLKFLTQDELEPEEDDDDDESYHEDMSGSDVADSEKEDSEDDDESLSSDENESGAVKPKVGYTCGSTATVVLFNNKKVYVANVGDSRCIASVNGLAVDLTVDHKPSDREELIRIHEAGSKVTEDDRVDGGLNMSRAFGDFAQKKTDDINEAIICDPHVMSRDINKELDFIVIASDGIWNSMSSQEVVDYFNLRMKDAQLHEICEELFKFVMAPDAAGDGTGCDNISIIVIKFTAGCNTFGKYNELVQGMDVESGGSGDSEDNCQAKNIKRSEHLNVSECNKKFEMCKNGANHDTEAAVESEDSDIGNIFEILGYKQSEIDRVSNNMEDEPGSSGTSINLSDMNDNTSETTATSCDNTLMQLQKFLFNSCKDSCL